MACFTFMFSKLSIKKKSRKLKKPARFTTLTIEPPRFSELEDVESATPTDVISFGEGSPRVQVHTPRVPNALRLPRTFPVITVQVPTEDEKDVFPDLPEQVLAVYGGLPTSSDWGATERMAIKRLEHLRLLDQVAYKKARGKGLKTPLPPNMRA